ncbi:unnamed protein product [Blepharisma stoltei]|uniref:Uncharacterized protein n=1 Tax=Blepharisma stoltei TaxID=1481888 RepID=A0AAU9I6V7_9CILI|nr:unnamed protein product [Blepharisma stoltei]
MITGMMRLILMIAKQSLRQPKEISRFLSPQMGNGQLRSQARYHRVVDLMYDISQFQTVITYWKKNKRSG